MAEVPEVMSSDAAEVLASGRRHLAVKDYGTAVSTLGRACELLAAEHGEAADQCADAYLWYGKALLGLAREESGVLGDRVPQGDGDAERDSDEDQDENGDENGDDSETGENGETKGEGKESTSEEVKPEGGKSEESKPEGSKPEEVKAEGSKPEENIPEGSILKEGNEAGTASKDNETPGPSNGEGNGDESVAELGDEEDVDNLQLAWEMLELSKSILERRAGGGGGDAARALLADVHLALGEVALESETYDKAVIDMQHCLDIQKKLYKNDDRRIAETHYQIGLANSLSSNFEEAITHFKNAANILETRIQTLENPTAAEDATVKKYSAADPFYSVTGEVKELKELLPEIHEKIQDMLDYKAETLKRVREQLCPPVGQGSSNGQGTSNGAGGSAPARQASDISHLIKRKRKPSEGEEGGNPVKNIKL